jgi:predicted Zn-dependent peptidase
MNATLQTLDCGVRLLCDPDPNARTAAVGVWLRTGARWETAGENGIAHFLEHLVFKGAGGRSARELAEAAEDRGVILNAHTGYERTAYHARCMGEDALFALDLIADMLLAPHLEPADLEVERGVVLQEIAEAEDDPEDKVGVLHQAAVFARQPLGRPILGPARNLSRFGADDARRFLDAALTPDRIVVAAAGAVDPAAVAAWAQSRFAGRHAGAGFQPAPAAPRGGVQTRIRAGEQLHLMLSLPAPPVARTESLAARLGADILGGGAASRLFQDLRETRGLAYSVEAWWDAYEDAGRLCVATACAPKDAADIAARVASHIADLASAGPTEQEVARARRIARAGVAMGRESWMGRCEAGASQTFIFGRPIGFEETDAQIAAVDADAIRAVFAAATRSPHAAAAAVGPRNGVVAAQAFVDAWG